MIWTLARLGWRNISSDFTFLCICSKKKFARLRTTQLWRRHSPPDHFDIFSYYHRCRGNIILTFFRMRYFFFYPICVSPTVGPQFFCLIHCLSYVLRPKNAIKLECATQLRFGWSKMQTNQNSGGLENFPEWIHNLKKSLNNIWILILFKLPKTTRNQKQKSVEKFTFFGVPNIWFPFMLNDDQSTFAHQIINDLCLYILFFFFSFHLILFK